MRKMGNKYINANPNARQKAYIPNTDKRKALNWHRDGLIWRTLATYSEVLGRTPCRSSSPRCHLKRVLPAAQFLDMHGHAAASCK
jgi:hypothetical protein